jgi:hypothetical protein
MSNEITLPNVDDASSTLMNKVWSNAYFQKLSSFGIVPGNAEEAQSLIDIAGRLAVIDAQSNTKSASASPYAAALQDLDSLMAGQPGHQKQADANFASKVAEALMAESDVYLSVLSLSQAAAAADAK